MKTMGDFLRAWHEYMLANPEQRVGQSLFNFAWIYSGTNHIAKEVHCTDLDTFYNDAAVLGLLEKIQKEVF